MNFKKKLKKLPLLGRYLNKLNRLKNIVIVLVEKFEKINHFLVNIEEYIDNAFEFKLYKDFSSNKFDDLEKKIFELKDNLKSLNIVVNSNTLKLEFSKDRIRSLDDKILILENISNDLNLTFSKYLEEKSIIDQNLLQVKSSLGEITSKLNLVQESLDSNHIDSEFLINKLKVIDENYKVLENNIKISREINLDLKNKINEILKNTLDYENLYKDYDTKFRLFESNQLPTLLNTISQISKQYLDNKKEVDSLSKTLPAALYSIKVDLEKIAKNKK